MKIALYNQHITEASKSYIIELFHQIETLSIEAFIEENFYISLQEEIGLEKEYKTFNHHSQLDASFDAMLTIGGDGTILRAITYVRDTNIPFLGINTGRLGFLATALKDEIAATLKLLIQKKYYIKERSLLSVSTTPPTKYLKDMNFALNEISVSRKTSTSMITVETYLDDEFLTSYWADGLIVATPTGSTGYSLSCGGPVITPQANNFVLTPIAPHNLNARPLVIPDNTEITLQANGRENESFLSLDSRISTIHNDTIIHIKKADFTLKMIQINKQTFIKTLREKLLWGEDTRNTKSPN